MNNKTKTVTPNVKQNKHKHINCSHPILNTRIINSESNPCLSENKNSNSCALQPTIAEVFSQ